MNKKKQIGMAILAVLMTASVTVWAANDPLTISADTLSYDCLLYTSKIPILVLSIGIEFVSGKQEFIENLEI